MSLPKMKGFLKSLNMDEESQVFRALLAKKPDLIKEAYDTAMGIVVGVTADDIMNEVFYGVASLDVEVLYGRSGRTRYGYVEPHDESWVMFEETLEPFISEMKKNQQRALPAAAKNHCIGIIKGLRRYEQESRSDFTDWVTDAPGEYIYSVVDEWKKGSPSDEDIADIMNVARDG